MTSNQVIEITLAEAEVDCRRHGNYLQAGRTRKPRIIRKDRGALGQRCLRGRMGAAAEAVPAELPSLNLSAVVPGWTGETWIQVFGLGLGLLGVAVRCAQRDRSFSPG
jgi:hypothetical protein